VVALLEVGSCSYSMQIADYGLIGEGALNALRGSTLGVGTDIGQ
jgi:hypothetical protein